MPSFPLSRHRILPRHVTSVPPAGSPITLITGLEGVGKRTVAQRLSPHLRVIDLSTVAQRERVRHVSADDWADTIGAAVLLHVQKEPDVIGKVATAWQSHGMKESVLLMTTRLGEPHPLASLPTMAWRQLELWPLMASEIILHAGRGALPAGRQPLKPLLNNVLSSAENADALFGNQPEYVAAEQMHLARLSIDHLLQWGGFPNLLQLNDDQRLDWLRQYEQSFPERDAAVTSRVKPLPFRRFRRLCAEHAGDLLSYVQLTREARINGRTSRRYIEQLAQLYQITLLPAYEENLTNALIKSPKLQLLDVGLWRQLTQNFGNTNSHIFQMMVLAEIYKWVKTCATGTHLAFYRTHAHMEVELLLTTPAGVWGLSTVYSDRVRSPDWRGLVDLGQALGDRWRGGMVVYSGTALEQLRPNIWAVPVERLLALPGQNSD